MAKATGRVRAERQQKKQNQSLHEFTEFPHIIEVRTDLKSLAHEGGKLSVHSSHLMEETQITDVYATDNKSPLYYKEEDKQNRKILTTENNLAEITLSFQKKIEMRVTKEELEFQEINHSNLNENPRSFPACIFVNQNRFKYIHGQHNA